MPIRHKVGTYQHMATFVRDFVVGDDNDSYRFLEIHGHDFVDTALHNMDLDPEDIIGIWIRQGPEHDHRIGIFDTDRKILHVFWVPRTDSRYPHGEYQNVRGRDAVLQEIRGWLDTRTVKTGCFAECGTECGNLPAFEYILRNVFDISLDDDMEF
jgi:hypothetical protein